MTKIQKKKIPKKIKKWMPVKIIWWIINKQINKPWCEIPNISKHGKFISIDPGCSSEERRNQVTFVSNNSRW